MRTLLAIVIVSAMAAAAMPVSGTGGLASFRILSHADVGFAALSSSCPQPSYNVLPTDPPPRSVPCFVLRNTLGYDGLTGAQWDTTDHLNHAFTCAVTSSATPGFETFGVSFDLDGDTSTDVDYPEGFFSPLSDVLGVDDHTLANDGGGGGSFQGNPGGIDLPNDPTGVPDVDGELPDRANPGWYRGSVLDMLVLGQRTNVVSGVIPGNFAIIFNNFGEDVTIDCTF